MFVLSENKNIGGTLGKEAGRCEGKDPNDTATGQRLDNYQKQKESVTRLSSPSKSSEGTSAADTLISGLQSPIMRQ